MGWIHKHIRIKYLAIERNRAIQNQRFVFLTAEASLKSGARGEREQGSKKPSAGLPLRRMIGTKGRPQKPRDLNLFE